MRLLHTLESAQLYLSFLHNWCILLLDAQVSQLMMTPPTVHYPTNTFLHPLCFLPPLQVVILKSCQQRGLPLSDFFAYEKSYLSSIWSNSVFYSVEFFHLFSCYLPGWADKIMQIASNHCIFILHAASQLKNVPLKQAIPNDRHDISVLSLSFFFYTFGKCNSTQWYWVVLKAM